jgi:hypothetical protein
VYNQAANSGVLQRLEVTNATYLTLSQAVAGSPLTRFVSSADKLMDPR